MTLWRDASERQAIRAAIADVHCAAVWLKVENFGDDASGEKVVAYIEGCRDLHSLAVPLVSDNVGGLPGLGVLAAGAVGGIAHGVTVQQSFRTGSWRRPPAEGRGSGYAGAFTSRRSTYCSSRARHRHFLRPRPESRGYAAAGTPVAARMVFLRWSGIRRSAPPSALHPKGEGSALSCLRPTQPNRPIRLSNAITLPLLV